MTTLGVYSCRWRELRPINFGGHSAATASGALQNHDGQASADGGREGSDQEAGYGRGGRRGRGKDGAGEYEMVGLKNDGTAN